MSRAETMKDDDKTVLKWNRPFMVTEILSEDVYKLVSMLGKEYTAHACRLMYYEPSGYIPQGDLKNVFIQDYFKLRPGRLLDFGRDGKHWKLKISWMGLPKEYDTWEPLMNIYERLSEGVEKRINKLNDEKDRESIRQYIAEEARKRHVQERDSELVERNPSRKILRLHAEYIQRRKNVLSLSKKERTKNESLKRGIYDMLGHSYQIWRHNSKNSGSSDDFPLTLTHPR